MSYRQYTQCTSSYVSLATYMIPYGGVGGVLAALGLVFGFIVPGLMIAALSSLIGYCNWWLYHHLICLGGDVCAVASLWKSISPAGNEVSIASTPIALSAWSCRRPSWEIRKIKCRTRSP